MVGVKGGFVAVFGISHDAVGILYAGIIGLESLHNIKFHVPLHDHTVIVAADIDKCMVGIVIFHNDSNMIEVFSRTVP